VPKRPIKPTLKKSTGPNTERGKANSSRNPIRHGLCSTSFVFENEGVDEYYKIRDSYVIRFGARDQVELDLIDRMVHATWNQQRAWAIEHEMMNMQMRLMEPQLAREYSAIPPTGRITAAFVELAKSPALHLIQRYEARLSGEYQRALKTLLELRKYVPLAPLPVPTMDLGPEIPGPETIDEPDPVSINEDETNPIPNPDTPAAVPASTEPDEPNCDPAANEPAPSSIGYIIPSAMLMVNEEPNRPAPRGHHRLTAHDPNPPLNALSRPAAERNQHRGYVPENHNGDCSIACAQLTFARQR